MRNENKLSFQVSGRFALFSDPLTRVGGEKCSYQVPTYQALKGIMESIYWKPTLIWRIDRVRVLKPIQTQSKGIRPLKYSGGNDLSIYTYLREVAYQVEVHFEWNENRPDLAPDRNEDKHYQIAARMLERGGRRDVFLGTRECQAYVEPCAWGEGEGAYDSLPELSFGVMFHSFDYPDENGQGVLRARLWHAVMRQGVIDFLRPEDCTLVRELKKQSMRIFKLGESVTPCGELYEEEGLS